MGIEDLDTAVRSPPLPVREPPSGPPHVVIVGAGFGGLSVAKALARVPLRLTVIDERNYHLFQPLLYQVATAALSPADIAGPIRSILARQQNARVLLGQVIGVDPSRRVVQLSDRTVGYDYLVLATGARHAYFGHDEWAPVAPGLKNLDDATALRRKILLAFEHAEDETDAAERSRLMTFVVIGGGATGVELAGAIAELAKVALAKDFRRIDTTMSRIILIEAGPRLLPAFPERLSAVAKTALEKLGVEIRLGRAVTRCDASGVALGDDKIDCRTIIWAAGVRASLAAEWLSATHDRAGRVTVAPDLTLPEHPEIFVIGDTALVLDKAGKPLPGVAPVAKQQGKYVAAVLRARVAGKAAPRPFRYHNFGNLATIGRSAAVVDFGAIKLTGRLAWLVWSVAHIYFLIGFRNRLVVAMNWLWSYVTFQRGARLITSRDIKD
jgi:NADH:ubiquinone reductase (H+-translocating)